MSVNLNFKLSKSVLSTISPPIPQAYKWASRYVPTGQQPLLDMSQGVPGTEPHVLLKKALRDVSTLPNSFGYCPAGGERTLREALVEEMKRVYDQNADITPEDIAVTSGCNLAFVATIMSLADAGDEVILPIPWYFNHQMTLSLLGINTVPLETFASNGFQPSVDRCASLITPRTRAIALVTPNNPTGAIYSSSLIASFSALAHSNNIALILDETYRDFITPPLPPHHIFSKPSSGALWRSHLISLYSFSKSYRIPGHRIGAITASPDLLPHITTILDTLQICAPRLPQVALATPGLLPSLREDIHETSRLLNERHKLFKNSIPPGWKIASQGGYFAFVRHPFVGVSSSEVCKRLAMELGVILLPGSFFREEKASASVADDIVVDGEEEDRWIRFSVANVDDAKVKKVCERLAECGKAFGWKTDEEI